MKKIKILWTDDEIDLLKPHILFLTNKGYDVVTASNGDDAIDLVKEQNFDLIFLDENMPGKGGLETLNILKTFRPNIPVIMITKNEEEDIMDAAIGSKISDYLIKPVNPKQILLAIKKNLETEELITKETTSAYQSEFMNLSQDISFASDFQAWTSIYKKLVFWELELGNSTDQGLNQVLSMQKNEANNAFSKFIAKNYLSWFERNKENAPLMSPNIFAQKIIPMLDAGEKVFFIVIDNLRYDQWMSLSKMVYQNYDPAEEALFCSILPTATQYARNAMFAGLMPLEISKLHPEFWVSEESDEGKNNYESQLLQKQLNRLGRNSINMRYEKILNQKTSKKILENYTNLLNHDLVALVYNFVDMLSHARTDMEMIRELASDEPAYRSLTDSWFRHSDLYTLLKKLSEEKVKVVITTDHGTIRVHNPIKVVGDKKSSVNLRYKQGRNLNYNPKEVFEITKPEKAHLPLLNVSTSYIFALNNDFMAYPNNYNYYVSYYRNTFQHGGVSLEEMMTPFIVLDPK